jgi:hypothetical protein
MSVAWELARRLERCDEETPFACQIVTEGPAVAIASVRLVCCMRGTPHADIAVQTLDAFSDVRHVKKGEVAHAPMQLVLPICPNGVGISMALEECEAKAKAKAGAGAEAEAGTEESKGGVAIMETPFMGVELLTKGGRRWHLRPPRATPHAGDTTFVMLTGPLAASVALGTDLAVYSSADGILRAAGEYVEQCGSSLLDQVKVGLDGIDGAVRASGIAPAKLLAQHVCVFRAAVAATAATLLAE